ncbi:MAG: hypothetical protein GY929_00765 [Actinomycetia bacterium]|nr:hypothetical protein [Actinomycetes bacterium]
MAGDPNGVYGGVRVLELATGLAAPYTGMFLADHGADVVKVESAEGDPYRTDPGFQTINRNKRSVVVDDHGLSSLIDKADVIIVDQPGRIDELRAANPGAIILAMPPWGERGAKVHDPVTTSLLHAATGVAWNQQSYAEVPVDLVVPVAEYGTGVLGALAAVSALFLRVTTGRVAAYEISGVAGSAALQLGEFRPAGPAEERPGDSGLGSKGRVACYRLVEAGDGQWFFLACGTSRFYERMLDVIGRPELIDDPLLANPPWGLMLDEAIGRITPILDEVFATKPRAEWLELLAAADVPAQPVLTRDEFLTTSMVAANTMDIAVDHPELGEVRMMGVPLTLDSAPGSVRHRAPLVGEHTAAVQAEWGSAPSPPEAGPGDGQRPLAGIRVIDLSSFIAGPVVSRHLAMLGAEVTKVEPPTGDPFRAIGPPFLSWNQGKKSVALDLTTAEGQATLHRMAADADAIIENFRPGVSERLGCDPATLGQVNPNLVFLSSPGYGFDESMADKAAFDPLVQALGGFMAAQGGMAEAGDGAEPVFLSAPVHDVTTPTVGAFGVVMGLHRRAQTGDGQHIHTSLAQSTMVAQAAEYTRYDGRPVTALGGFDHPGVEGNTWEETDDGPVWVDGQWSVPVEVRGLTGSELAEANDLLTEHPTEAFGPLVVFGQLIGGAGPAPAPAPVLDDHGDEIRANYSGEGQRR